MGLFRSSSNGKPVLIADVESGSVGVAVAVIGKSGPATVVASERASLPIETRAKEQAATSITNLLGETAARVVKKYSDEAGKKYGPVTSLHAVVGAPWVRSRTAKAETVFGEEKTITDAMIKDLAKQALQQASELVSQNIFETSVTRVQLNGYPTPKPAGKRARSILVVSFQSDIDPSIRSGIEHALGAVAPGRKVDLRSETRALLTVQHERSDVRHYLLLSMGTDATNCTAVYKEDLSSHTVLEEGVGTIVKKISGPTGLPEGTLSMFRMLVTDSCSTPACQELKNNMATVEPAMVKSFGETFGKLAATRRLPNSCFLSVNADISPWLEHFLARIDFSQFTIAAQPFVVESLSPEHMRTFVVWDTGTREDTGIGVAASFVNITKQST